MILFIIYFDYDMFDIFIVWYRLILWLIVECLVSVFMKIVYCRVDFISIVYVIIEGCMG